MLLIAPSQRQYTPKNNKTPKSLKIFHVDWILLLFMWLLLQILNSLNTQPIHNCSNNVSTLIWDQHTVTVHFALCAWVCDNACSFTQQNTKIFKRGSCKHYVKPWDEIKILFLASYFNKCFPNKEYNRI